MRAVLFSIRPQHCFDIANYDKLNEVRKIKPKIDVPFKGYIYCTKGGKLLYKSNRDNAIRLTEWSYRNTILNRKHTEFNGKVIGEFICNNIDEFTAAEIRTSGGGVNAAIECSCLSIDELLAYKGAEDVLYFIDISDLVIYDKPKELSEFYRECEENECDNCPYLHFENTPNSYEGYCTVGEKKPIKRAPQSYCFVEELPETEVNKHA